MKKLTLLVPVLLAVLLGACTTGNADYKTPYLDRSEFAALSADEQAVHLGDAILEGETWRTYKTGYLKAGRMVQRVENGVKITTWWDQDMRQLSVYEGHITSTFGSESALLLKILTEKEAPVPLITQDPRTGQYSYSIIAANVSNQETMGRVFAKGFMNITTGILSNSLAAHIGKCDGDCGGNLTLNNGASASAKGEGSAVSGNTNTSTLNSGCTDCAKFD